KPTAFGLERAQELRCIAQLGLAQTAGAADRRGQYFPHPRATIHESPHEATANPLAEGFADVPTCGAKVIALIQCGSEPHRESHRRAVTAALERKAIPVLQQPDRPIELSLGNRGARPGDRKDFVARRGRIMRLKTRTAAE